MQNREKGCSMVEQCSLASTSNFSALTMWPGRLQKQKGSCRSLTMMVREKNGTGTSMLPSTKNNMPSWRALQIMAIVAWTMAKSLPLSLRHQEH